MRYTLSSLFAASLLLALAAQAGDIYRWKDASGLWHYADQPVPGAERVNASQRGTTARPEAADSSTRSAAANAGQPSATSQVTQKVREDVAAAKASKCKEAQDAYDQSVAARRLFKVGADGEHILLSDDEVEAARVAARTTMEYYCSK